MSRDIKVKIAVIGGGPAGMAAAIAATEAGVRDVLIIERDSSLGGILRQCIHGGFGLHTFGEELSGPEYAYRYEERVKELKIPFMTNTMVTSLSADRKIVAMNKERGIFTVEAEAVILAMGCRERPKGALGISGSRPAGIYTAGTAQKFVNMKGYMPGREVVILGSGDIGLIMARRMTLEGAKVHAVCELMPYSGGLARNIEQCLNDYSIPLKLSHTVIEIHGTKRVEGVTIAKVDEHRQPIPGTEEYIPCDTLLLSCGLIPENELTISAGIKMDGVTGGAVVDADRQTSAERIYACGNVLHVHDLVDYVSEEAAIAGRAAARAVMCGLGDKGDVAPERTDYAPFGVDELCRASNNGSDGAAVDCLSERGKEKFDPIKIAVDGKIRYTVPHIISKCEKTTVYFRVSDIFRGARIVVRSGDKELISKKKLKLAPGEMETVVLDEEMLKIAEGGKLEFSVECEEGR